MERSCNSKGLLPRLPRLRALALSCAVFLVSFNVLAATAFFSGYAITVRVKLKHGLLAQWSSDLSDVMSGRSTAAGANHLPLIEEVLHTATREEAPKASTLLAPTGRAECKRTYRTHSVPLGAFPLIHIAYSMPLDDEPFIGNFKILTYTGGLPRTMWPSKPCIAPPSSPPTKYDMGIKQPITDRNAHENVVFNGLVVGPSAYGLVKDMRPRWADWLIVIDPIQRFLYHMEIINASALSLQPPIALWKHLSVEAVLMDYAFARKTAPLELAMGNDSVSGSAHVVHWLLYNQLAAVAGYQCWTPVPRLGSSTWAPPCIWKSLLQDTSLMDGAIYNIDKNSKSSCSVAAMRDRALANLDKADAVVTGLEDLGKQMYMQTRYLLPFLDPKPKPWLTLERSTNMVDEALRSDFVRQSLEDWLGEEQKVFLKAKTRSDAFMKLFASCQDYWL